MRPKVILAENYSPTQITYYAGSYLPQVKDAPGAEAGTSGQAGGQYGYHPRQVIRVSRGKAVQDKSIDAPKLRVEENSQLANLVALSNEAVPAPPVEALRRHLQSIRQFTRQVPVVVQPATSNPSMRMEKLRVHSVTPDVVQPPPDKIIRGDLSASKLVLPDAVVVPPPPETAKLTLPSRVPAKELASAVVPPAPSLDGMSSTDDRVLRNLMPQTDVVQPSPATEQLSGNNRAVPQMPGYAELAPSASAPSPIRGALDATAQGFGSGGGDQKIQAIVMSANPGNKVGVPTETEGGSIALSPTGRGEKGMGGSGGGTGASKGTGTGIAESGNGSGKVSNGSGAGASTTAKNGTSNRPGPGGTGTGGTNSASLSGITISGGTATLASFGPANVPITTSQSKVLGPRHAPSITIVGSATSGGALNRYGALKGGKVYTIYIQTRLGTAVLEFAERVSTSQKFEADLTAPEPMQSEIPADVRNSRMIVSCVIGPDGVLRNLQVLESAASDMTAKMVSALQGWRFRPVLRGDQAIAVDAILGFDIDTR